MQKNAVLVWQQRPWKWKWSRAHCGEVWDDKIKKKKRTLETEAIRNSTMVSYSSANLGVGPN